MAIRIRKSIHPKARRASAEVCERAPFAFDLQLFGGSSSQQSTSQTSSTVQQSTTNANRTTSINVSQTGLTGDQANQLISGVNNLSRQGSVADAVRAGLVGVNEGASSPAVLLAVLIIFAALIFRR